MSRNATNSAILAGGIGYQYVAASPVDGFKATYSAAFVSLSPGTAVATTDIATIYGSATANRVIRVLQVGLSATVATAALFLDVVIAKRSTVPTGGTPTALVAVPNDGSDAAGTATTLDFWTAPPTAGTLIGNVATQKLFAPVTGTPALFNPLVFNFGSNPGKAIVLRGIGSGLGITIGGATLANAASISGWIVWTEETVITDVYS